MCLTYLTVWGLETRIQRGLKGSVISENSYLIHINIEEVIDRFTRLPQKWHFILKYKLQLTL